MQINGIKIDMEFVAGLATEQKETLNDFITKAVEERCERIMREKVKDTMLTAMTYLDNHGYDPVATIDKMGDMDSFALAVINNDDKAIKRALAEIAT